MERGIKKRKLKDKAQFQFYIPCPECTKEIRGTSVKHVESNLDTHLKLKHMKGVRE